VCEHSSQAISKLGVRRFGGCLGGRVVVAVAMGERAFVAVVGVVFVSFLSLLLIIFVFDVVAFVGRVAF
jgi:hypothetical protein